MTSATRTSIKMADGLGLDSWWDEPADAASQDTGAFTVAMALLASQRPHS